MTAFKDRLHQIIAPHRQALILACVCALLVALCAVGLLGVSGWFLTACAVFGASGPLIASGLNYVLPSAFIRAMAILRTGLRYVERLSGHQGGLMAMADLRPELFHHISQGPPQTLLSLSRGTLLSRLIEDIGIVENQLIARSAPFAALGSIVMALIFCCIANPLMAMVLALCLGLAYLLAYGLIMMEGLSLEDDQAILEVLSKKAFSLIPVLADMAAFSLGSAKLKEFEQLENELQTVKIKKSGLDYQISALIYPMIGLTIFLICLLAKPVAPPFLAMALLSTSMGFEGLQTLLMAISQTPTQTMALTRLNELYDMNEAHICEDVDGSKTGHLNYKGTDFSLDTKTRLLIDGPSGSGKSRLIETLISLRPMPECPHLSAESSFHKGLFSLCPQDASVLSGTIRENLAMATKDEDAMWQALDISQLSHKIKSLAKGLDTWVGEGGISLSGGEKKRLSLARALLRPAPLLILDESTEGLDAATETRLILALSAYLETANQGLILISHRLPPRSLCSQILMI